MKQYTKPTIAIAAATGTSNPVFCSVQADLELIKNIIGDGFNWDQAFALTEACKEGIPLEIYCKFTSAELGLAQAFLS